MTDHRSPPPPVCADVHRPRFVQSSNIRPQLQQISEALWASSRPISVEFAVNVELNALVSRSTAVTPSQLMRDNLVFVARMPRRKPIFLAHKSKLPVDPEAIVANDVFVVALVLKAVVAGDAVSVEPNRSVELLQSCDPLFVDYLVRYIRRCVSDIRQDSFHDDSTLSDFSDLSDIALVESSETVHGHDDFLVDINNLRHNEDGHEFVRLKPWKPELKPAAVEHSASEALLRKQSLTTAPKPEVIRKSPSFTISADDLESAKFAPIKGDRKFKYIKVGKVQKFVHLFEEKVQEETLSRPSSPQRHDRIAV